MNRSFQLNQIFAFFLILLTAVIIVTVITADSSASSLEVSLPDQSHEVEGLSSKEVESDLTIRNTDSESVNVSIETEHPIGEETKATVDIYPQVALGSKGQGQHYEMEIDGEKSRPLVILISVNDSAFADTYTFPVTVTNLDNPEEEHGFILTIVVQAVNEIDIKLDEKEDEKSIRPGYSTQFYFKVTNLGNIFQEKVTLDIDYEGNNLTAVVDPEDTILNPIHAVMREEDAVRIFAVTLSAIEEKGDGIFEIDIHIETPDHEGDHHYTTVTLRVSTSDPPPPQPTTQPISDDFPLPVFMGGILVIIAAMGTIGKVFVYDKMDDEEIHDDWGNEGPAWEMEEGSNTGMIAEDFQMPITSSPFDPPEGPEPLRPVKPEPPIGFKGDATSSSPEAEKASGPGTRTIHSQDRSSKISSRVIHSSSRGMGDQGTRDQGMKRSGPRHVKCPGCRSGLKISNPKRPLTISCPKCSTKFTLKNMETNSQRPSSGQGQVSTEATRTAPNTVSRSRVPVHVKCPDCSTGLKISNPRRPLTISCPKCNRKITLKVKGTPTQNTATQSRSPTGPVHVKCPKCRSGLKISNPRRPLTIPCPKCSTKFTIKDKKKGASSNTSSKGSGQASTARSNHHTGLKDTNRSHETARKKVQQISCPKCTIKFRVSNPSRPLSVSCPKCRIKLNLK